MHSGVRERALQVVVGVRRVARVVDTLRVESLEAPPLQVHPGPVVLELVLVGAAGAVGCRELVHDVERPAEVGLRKCRVGVLRVVARRDRHVARILRHAEAVGERGGKIGLRAG